MKHLKANHAKKIDPLSLRWSDNAVLVASTEKPLALPPTDTCRRILAAIGQAWDQRKPWSTHVQAKPGGTYAAERISRQFDIPAETAERLLHEWLINDVVALELWDARNKKHGLKVIGGID